MLLPLLFIITPVIICYFISSKLTHVNKPKLALLISYLVLSIFSYGPIYGLVIELLSKFSRFNIYIEWTSLVIFGIYISILILGLSLILKAKRLSVDLTYSCNLISVILVSLPLIQIVFYNFSNFQPKFAERELKVRGNYELPLNNGKHSQEKPDIYYLIFDRYGSYQMLKKYLGFDDSPLKNYLTGKGFYFFEDSRANYPKTFLSLASSLNMEHLDYLPKILGENNKDQTYVNFEKLQNYKIWQFLDSFDYTYIHIGSGWTPTRENKYAHINIRYQNPLYDEFFQLLFKSTLIYPVTVKLFPDILIEGAGKRERFVYKLEKLQEIVELDGPKFVFAHFLLPHEPFVFGPLGQPVTSYDLKTRSIKENYLRQLEYTSLQIRNLVENILLKSKNKPIIILQSDEGPFVNQEFKGAAGVNVDWSKLGTEAIQTHMGILNAFYLPGISMDAISPTITPVNTFRLIFNLYFGTDFPLLPDKSYIIKDMDHPYLFIDVTDRLND